MEILKVIFRWFYCLDIPVALFFIAMATGVFLLVYKRYQGTFWLSLSVCLLLICWIGAVGCATLGIRNEISDMQINLMPFHSFLEVCNGGNTEIYRSNFMNIVLFYPGGLLAASLLPRKWPGWCRCILVVAVLAVMSAGIEFMQYRYSLGRCEIDDVIHNAVGALLGSLAVMIFHRKTIP